MSCGARQTDAVSSNRLASRPDRNSIVSGPALARAMARPRPEEAPVIRTEPNRVMAQL